ncbi:putative glycoside hydrolase [Tepidibacter formicigenes]|jgi:hypothetical protein|uniref:SH3b domain-containing protein n=1 Tax=Tepidibacter formicigenes DSM 15518 TaxID=1123349 RepID=A0A1M6PN59_9FIRM|nr:putative glycoside hydrolase [Tepidibacter formicigenes]SHK09371.1 hypothetical protein SAMN02744037_01603 [Tepidibacter formicigenes DSM 15518]
MKKRYVIFITIIVITLELLIGCNNNSLKNPAVTEKPIVGKNNKQEVKEKIKKEENIFYVKPSELNVRENPTKKSNIIDKLKKFNKVIILGEHEEKDDNGEIISTWYRVKFINEQDENKIGWISSNYVVKTREEILSDKLKGIDFSPQEKTFEYPNNKRKKVKGIYLTIHSAIGERLEKLIELSKKSEINAFVIDVKDDYGKMLFKTDAAQKYAPIANEKAISKRDMKNLVKKLKENDIYLIARIVTFKDPTYTQYYPERAIMDKTTGEAFVSKDKLRWASPHDRNLWDYDIQVAKEAAKIGFNEIQFDYVRFPASNGGKLDAKLDYRNNNGDISKPQTIQSFLKYARENISKENVYISADIFGLVASVTDDMGLGQYWEAVSNVVDYVCPMMYPSHYGNTVYGLDIPDAHPYETVFQSAKDSIKRNKNIDTPATIRPWIQDFTASWVRGHIKYNENEVKAQIKALNDNGIDEYILWNAGNKYSFE